MSSLTSSLHPLRWAAVVLVALPFVLWLLAGAASLSGNADSARSLLRGLRCLLVVEIGALLLLACAGAVYEAASRKQERRLYQPPGKLVDIGGRRLHLYCSGEGGPTVVLEHGLQGSYLDWYRVQPEVARFTRVCSYDRAGYGWSDPSSTPRVPSVLAEELNAVLANSGEKPPYILVGHSFASFDALMYAHKYRDDVAGVVLVDGSHPEELLPFPWRSRLWLRMMQLTMPIGLPRWRRWCGSGPAEIEPIKRAFTCRSQVYGATFAQWSAFPDSAQEVAALGPLGDLPLVVISRDPDRVSEEDGSSFAQQEQHWQGLQQELVRLSTDGTQLTAKGSGHDIPGERPEVVVDGIRRVVERVRRKN